jgi:hypothetical protein
VNGPARSTRIGGLQEWYSPERSHDGPPGAQYGHEAASEDRSSSRRWPRALVARIQRDVGLPRKYAGWVAERRWCQRVSMNVLLGCLGVTASCDRGVGRYRADSAGGGDPPPVGSTPRRELRSQVPAQRSRRGRVVMPGKHRADPAGGLRQMPQTRHDGWHAGSATRVVDPDRCPTRCGRDGRRRDPVGTQRR